MREIKTAPAGGVILPRQPGVHQPKKERLMKILIAADGSDHTQRVLDYLATHEWLANANQFTVITVVPEVPKRAASYLDHDTVHGYYKEEAEKVLDPVRAFFTLHRMEAQFEFKVGHPGDVISHFATEGGYDLLMMGSHGHGALGKLIMGSVATKVLSACQVPLLILR
jgi:nucleotide-binding universal stress UspA family protein